MTGTEEARPRPSAGARLSRAARRVLELVPITPLGALVAGTAAWSLRTWAYGETDLVLLVAGFGVLGMVAAAALLVALGAIRLVIAMRARGALDDRSWETGRLVPTGFAIPGLLVVPLLQVRWTWESPDADVEVTRRGLSLVEAVRLPRRGHVEAVHRRLVVQDAFGLARVVLRDVAHVRWRLLPHPGRLRELPVLVSMAGGDEVPHPLGVDEGDRVELRRYAPGDPARHIHWKAFSRTRKLMVRMPERALSRSRRVVAYLVAGPDDEASAGAARVAVESGLLGAEWVFGADGTEGETGEVGAAVERVVRSARPDVEGGAGLRAFMDRAERRGPASLVLFVPPRPGPWLERVVSVVRARGARCRVVIAVDGLEAASPRRRWWSWISRSVRGRGADLRALEAVERAFSSVRCEAVVLDRKSGRMLGRARRGGPAVEAGRPIGPAGERAA